MNKLKINETFKEYLIVALGSFIYAASLNLFLIPYSLYSGGMTGTAQIIRTFLTNNFNIVFNFDIAGILNFIFNIPLIFLAYKRFKLSFVNKTIFSLVIQTIVFSIVPIFEKPLVSDLFASIFICAISSAFGSGMILVQKATAGGNDVTGMLVSDRYRTMTVGKFALYYNCVLYTICAVFFNVEIAIYSLFYTFLYSFVIDKLHLQNIQVSLMIFTKNKLVKKTIIEEFKRGVTYWQGLGAFTESSTEVLVTVVSKYEVANIRRKIKELDSNAFIIISGELNVDGGFEKRLI